MKRLPRIQDCLPEPGSQPETIHKDDHIWVITKPSGWLTHPDGTNTRPSVSEWCAEPVGIHQRLDIDTSGLLIVSRSKQGARQLQCDLESRRLKKSYIAALGDWNGPSQGAIKTPMPGHQGKRAHTKFRVLKKTKRGVMMACEPVTGRTHQLRFHFASEGHPIVGDGRYGDPLDIRAPRTLLHCETLTLSDGRQFESPLPPVFAPFQGAQTSALRRGLAGDVATTCYREVHGAADGKPGWYVDRYGDYLWVQQDEGATRIELPPAKGTYLTLGRRDRSHGGQDKPRLLDGQAAPTELQVLEHGTPYLVELGEQLSTGLFLDQRPQRAWLARHGHGLRILNTFAHAGGFSIAAATAGAQTLSIDLSKHWLGFIPRQLAQLGIDAQHHDCIYGDIFDWLPRLAKRGEKFDLIILDPPSTSVGRKKKRWSARTHYPELVRLAIQLLRPGGRLWTSTNHRGITPRRFAALVTQGCPELELERVCPPALDFPCRGPRNQKTFVWRWS